jgi:hypothetical protein
MTKDNIGWLQGWYFENCDGDWEHDERISIQTLDNPGWKLEVNLEGTQQEDLKTDFFERQSQENEDDWVHFKIEEGYFRGHCGPLNLTELIGYFRELVGG